MAKKKANPIQSAADIRAIRNRLGLSRAAAAEKVGVKLRTWVAWETPSQDRRPSESHAILIRLLAEGKLI